MQLQPEVQQPVESAGQADDSSEVDEDEAAILAAMEEEAEMEANAPALGLKVGDVVVVQVTIGMVLQISQHQVITMEYIWVGAWRVWGATPALNIR